MVSYICIISVGWLTQKSAKKPIRYVTYITFQSVVSYKTARRGCRKNRSKFKQKTLQLRRGFYNGSKAVRCSVTGA